MHKIKAHPGLTWVFTVPSATFTQVAARVMVRPKIAGAHLGALGRTTTGRTPYVVATE